jgi:hypothetical protein
MALPTWYSTGTVSVESGSTTVSAEGAFWGDDAIMPGDLFCDPAQPLVPPQRVKEVTGNAELELWAPWPGDDIEGGAYEIRYVGIIERSTAQTRKVLEQLGEVSAYYDVQVDALADRDDYDARPTGYRVLVSDIGDGRAAIYSKASSVEGDWTDPAYFSGPIGQKAWTPLYALIEDGDRVVFQLTEWVGGEGDAPEDDLGKYLGSGGFVEDIEDAVDIRGFGFAFKGAYDDEADYLKGDVVRDNGSAWITLQPTTGNAPPILPTTSNAHWALLAAKGQDGTGTGDVVGPASSVNNRIVVFSGPTGKSIADSGVPLTFASQAEAEAGSENTKFVTSLRVRQSIHASAGRYDANQSLTRAQKGVHAANVGIGWEKIDAVINLAGLASAQWTNLGDFCRLRMSMAGRPVNTGIPVIRVSQDNGASWDLGATDYQNTFLHTLNGAAPAATLVPQTYIYAAIQSWHQAYGGEVIFEISRFNKSSLSFYSSRIAEISGTNSNNQGGVAGYHNKIVANNAIIAFAPSGGWANGDIMLEGIRG